MVRVPDPLVILVTHPAFGDDVIVNCVRRCAAALPRGAFAVQLRDKRRALSSLRVFSWQLRIVTRSAGAWFVLNGHPEMARDVGADGVHVADRPDAVRKAREVCGAGFWVSAAAHSDHSVRAAVEDGADAVLVSPIFATREPFEPHETRETSAASALKQARGVDALRSAHAILKLSAPRAARAPARLLALGGVTVENAARCVEVGATGVAVVRALLCAVEPGRVARALHDAIVGRC